MNKCIYLKDNSNLTYKSEEHIFPAGIGGIKKLPKDYVSDQFNTEIFSKIELDFMRNSVISLPRISQRPGKRGSLSENYATKSNIALFDSADDSLVKLHFGYIKLGKPVNIPQILICGNGTCHLSFNPDDGEYLE